jgi:hypothetical protein
MKKRFIMWVVYCRPSDFPWGFVARRFVNGLPTKKYYFASVSLKAVREWIFWDARKHGLGVPYCLARHPNDDPVIYETWI